MPGAEVVDTVVIGAGHAGLAASFALSERALEHIVLEERRIGETWRADRWDSFRLNTPRWMSRLDEHALADDDADGFDTAGEFVNALEDTARIHGLPVEQHAGPATVERDASDRLIVRAARGATIARNVIIATGFQRLATRPLLAAALAPRLLQLDTATYRSPGEIAEGAVLVVGGGQSGCQIAEDLARAGRRVLLSTSRVGWVPRRYRGRDTLDWWTVTGVFAQRRADADPAVLRVRQPLISGTDDGHTLSLHTLARLGVSLLGRLQGGEGEKLHFGDEVAEHVRFGDEAAAGHLRAIDAYIERSGIAAEPAQPEPARGPTAGVGADAPRSLRLDREGVGTVIWCTGMLPRLDAVAIPGLVDGSAIAHTEGATAIPGLYVIGAPWLSCRKSGIIWGANDDATRIAAAVAAAHSRAR
jgi:putative flavoprotein involved in K+ transport